MKITNISNTLYQSRNNQVKAQKNQSNQSFTALRVTKDCLPLFERVKRNFDVIANNGHKEAAKLAGEFNKLEARVHNNKHWDVMYLKSGETEIDKIPMIILRRKSDGEIYDTCWKLEENDPISFVRGLIDAFKEAEKLAKKESKFRKIVASLFNIFSTSGQEVKE